MAQEKIDERLKLHFDRKMQIEHKVQELQKEMSALNVEYIRILGKIEELEKLRDNGMKGGDVKDDDE